MSTKKQSSSSNLDLTPLINALKEKNRASSISIIALVISFVALAFEVIYNTVIFQKTTDYNQQTISQADSSISVNLKQAKLSVMPYLSAPQHLDPNTLLEHPFLGTKVENSGLGPGFLYPIQMYYKGKFVGLMRPMGLDYSIDFDSIILVSYPALWNLLDPHLIEEISGILPGHNKQLMQISITSPLIKSPQQFASVIKDCRKLFFECSFIGTYTSAFFDDEKDFKVFSLDESYHPSAAERKKGKKAVNIVIRRFKENYTPVF